MDDLPLLSPRDSESYPRTKKHQFIKLLTHSYNFGRFDLATLLVEWLNYLLFTAFLAAWLEDVIQWDLASVAIPLYIAISLGFLRSGFCGKRSRCALLSRLLFCVVGTLLVLFVLLKAKKTISWSWDAVFSPLYGLFSLLCALLFFGWLASICFVGHDRLFKFELFIMWISFAIAMIFLHLLASKLDNYGTTDDIRTWWVVYMPMWIVHGLWLASFLIFLWVFPDKAFVEDNITRSHGSRVVVPSIKPRLRVNFFFVLTCIFNIPMLIFNLMLCYYMETKEATDVVPYNEAILFAPVFVAEVLSLAFAMSLMYARRRRGTYCIRIDNGPGVPATEIW